MLRRLLVALGVWVLGAFGLLYAVQSFRAQAAVDVQKALLGQADYDIALGKLEQARQAMPNYPDLWESRGKVLLLMSFFRQRPDLGREAERSYQQAANLEPLGSQHWVKLAEAQLLLGNNAGTLKSVAIGLKRDPYNAALHFYKGRAYQNLGDVTQARQAYLASDRILPNGDAQRALKTLMASK